MIFVTSSNVESVAFPLASSPQSTLAHDVVGADAEFAEL